MNEDSSKIEQQQFLRALGAQGNSPVSEPKKKENAIGKDEFLMMLVTQLKNQDPLDPMKGDEFAVNLAQFSQLEQLIGINEKLDKESNANSLDLSSLTAYLGQEVTLNSNAVEVINHNAGKLRIDVTSDAEDVVVELLKADGSVQESVSLGSLTAGAHRIDLNDLNTQNGEYTVQVTARGAFGNTIGATVSAAGVVTGFIPGPDPSLLIGEREVKPGDIREVNVAS